MTSVDRTADVIVVGGGPAGLSCAMVLGRSARKVFVFDTGKPRNRFSRAMHGFLSRDGEDPNIFLAKAREELKRYNVTIRNEEVRHAEKVGGLFKVTTPSGEYLAQKMLLATGLTDRLPDLPRISDYYGRSVFHCPYCDGWEMRDQPWLLFAAARGGAVEVALRLRTWTTDITLLASHVKGLARSDRHRLDRNGINIAEGKVTALHGDDGLLTGVTLDNGKKLPARALFFSTGNRQHCDLGSALKCACNSKGLIKSNHLQQTNVHGLYVAGDTAWDMQLVIIAAAEGAKAAVAINTELNKESRK